MGIATAFSAVASITSRPEVVEEQPAIEGGIVLGTTSRRYGLLTCEENIVVSEVWERSGDLAVADRMAYLIATRHHLQLAVFELDGWYNVGTIERPLTAEQALAIQPYAEGPRLMSIVDARGIMPVVGPLA